MNEEEIKLVNKTCRSSGAVGMNALVPRIIGERLRESAETLFVLDYGAGTEQIHVEALRSLWPEHFIFGYDIGDNWTNKHLPFDALRKVKWDIVYASNVINVQPTRKSLHETLSHLVSLSRDGVLIFNYPQSPRKLDIGMGSLLSICSMHFTHVEEGQKNVVTAW